MICRTTLALGAMALVSSASSATMAQNAPPSYEGDPDVYKVIFEDQNFRVIYALRKKGIHDKLHSHPVPSIVYHLTDCTSLLYGPDGKPMPSPTNGKAGTAFAVPIIPAHSAENIGLSPDFRRAQVDTCAIQGAAWGNGGDPLPHFSVKLTKVYTANVASACRRGDRIGVLLLRCICLLLAKS